MLAAPDATRFQRISDRGDRQQRHSVVRLRRVNIQVLDISKLRTLLHAKARHDGDVLVAFLEYAYWGAAHGRGRPVCDIGVGNAGDVGAVWIDLNPLLNIVREPIITKNGDALSLPDDVLSLPGNLSQGANIAGFISGVNVLLPGDQQLDRVVHRIGLKLANGNPRAWYFFVQSILDRTS